MAYKFIIHTNRYKDISINNSNSNNINRWDIGRLNAFMHAINGITYKEDNLKDLKRRVLYFCSNASYFSSENLNLEDVKWLKKWHNKNAVTFEVPFGLGETTRLVKLPNADLSLIDLDYILTALSKNGKVEIPLIRCCADRLVGSLFTDSLNGSCIEIIKLH